MKQLFISLLAITLSYYSFSQCTPDPQYTEPGFYTKAGENILPNAQKGVPYSEVITIIAYKDSVLGYPISVDSVILMNVRNLPSGIAYSTPSNSIVGGGKGCVLLDGTTSDNFGTYDVLLDVKLFLTGFPAAIDTNISFPFLVDWPASNKYTSFDAEKVVISPNPVRSSATIQIANFTTGTGEFTLSNVVGKEVYYEMFDLEEMNQSIDFSVADLPQGIYMYTLSINGQNKVGRLVISNE